MTAHELFRLKVRRRRERAKRGEHERSRQARLGQLRRR